MAHGMTPSSTTDGLISHRFPTGAPASDLASDTDPCGNSNDATDSLDSQLGNISAGSRVISRCEKSRIAGHAQREEIVKHRDILVRRLGRSVSLDDAARDWIKSYAAEWRTRFEARWRSPTVGK